MVHHNKPFSLSYCILIDVVHCGFFQTHYYHGQMFSSFHFAQCNEDILSGAHSHWKHHKSSVAGKMEPLHRKSRKHKKRHMLSSSSLSLYYLCIIPTDDGCGFSIPNRNQVCLQSSGKTDFCGFFSNWFAIFSRYLLDVYRDFATFQLVCIITNIHAP